MEQAIVQIKTALINSLSNDSGQREQANLFLMKQCEPDPQFQIALLHIIQSYSTAPSPNAILESQVSGEPSKVYCVAAQAAPRQPTAEEVQIQYQAIICMKNSLTRLMQQHRGRGFSNNRGAISNQVATSGGAKSVTFASAPAQRIGIPDELRTQIKAQLLQMIDNPENVILSKSSYEQLTLVVTIFVKYDFPVAWPQMNQWLIKSMDALHANMHNLQLEDAPRVQRFLGFYFEVLKEQRKKQLNSSKSHFYRVSKEHLKGIVRVWLFFNEQQSNMIFDAQTQALQPLASNYNASLFAIAAKLDKCLMYIVGCGFSINNLVAEPENNQFVETVSHLIQKLKLQVTCAELCANLPDSPDKERYMEILVSQVKTFLKNLCSLQSSEPLLMFNSLDQYLQILARILHRNEIYTVRVNKLALIATFKVVNVDCFNQGSKRDASSHSDGIGILVSPVKFKNLEPQIAKASELYRQVLEIPLPNSDLIEEQTRQDGARKILELVTKHFLSKVDLSSWQSDPEYFIENEDEQFLLEYDLQDDCSLNLLAQHLIEKLLQKFYPTCYPFIQEILNQYFNGQLIPETVQIEDALLNLVGIVGKVQKEYKIKLEKRLDVNFVLQFIKSNRWNQSDQSPIFRRRFLLILTHWVKILPKPIFFQLLNTVLESLSTLGQPQAMLQLMKNNGIQPNQMSTLEQVLAFEHCCCIHEMLKEVHFWLNRAEQLSKGISTTLQGELSKDIFELRGSAERFTESEEEQISHCQYINMQVNYAQLFQLVGSKLVPLLDVFKSPSLIWQMINCLSFILEKTVSQPEIVEGCLKYLNILRILETQTECHVDEAIIDMLKNLLIQCPASPVILDMCCTLLNFKLAKTLNDGSTMQFWLFTMRAVSTENPSLPKLKELFVRFSGCLSSNQSGSTGSSLGTSGTNSVAYTTIKRDYIFLEFLKVAKEAVLLDMFDTFEEATQLTQFATYKFDCEVEAEKKVMDNAGGGASSGADSAGYDSDEGGNIDSAMYEKKEHILLIPHILMWKVESTSAVDATLQQQKALLVQCCTYLIQSRALVTLPNSNVFFQQLVTYINRVLIIKPDDFIMGILLQELIQRGFTFAQFVEAWLAKMEMIVQWEAHRIKSLALLVILPYLSGEIIQQSFGEIGKLLFDRLENDLYFKLTNEKGRSKYSPNRFSNSNKYDSRNPNAVNIKIHEKVSQRFEKMKREDWLLEFDLIDIFWQKVRDLMTKLQIQTIDPLVECLPTDEMKVSFTNLVNGFSLRHERLKAEQLEQSQREQSQQMALQQSLLEQHHAIMSNQTNNIQQPQM